MRVHDTIIVGGGIAGLACAKRLHDEGKEFLLLTPRIGGRIFPSKDGKVNFGAFFITRNYKHVRSFVDKKDRLKQYQVLFQKTKEKYTVLSRHFLGISLQYLILRRKLNEFKRHHRLFRQRCEEMTQKKALEMDPYLLKLYTARASDWVEENKLERITEEFLDELIHGIVFCGVKDISALLFIQWISEVILNPTYEFTFNFEKILQGYKERIKREKVSTITRIKRGFIVNTRKRTYRTGNLVLAVEPWETKRLLGLKKMNSIIRGHAIYLTGDLLSQYTKGHIILFPSKGEHMAICKEGNAYVVFSKYPDPDLKNYFSEFHIIEKKDWPRGFLDAGPHLEDFDRGSGLYLAGSYNIEGMEDCYLTGLFAANKIIERARTS